MAKYQLRVSLNRAQALEHHPKDKNVIPLTEDTMHDALHLGTMIMSAIKDLGGMAHIDQFGFVVLVEQLNEAIAVINPDGDMTRPDGTPIHPGII